MSAERPWMMLLGVTQDAGYPQAGCYAPCCAPAWKAPDRRLDPACLGIVDERVGRCWMIDCTPRFPTQLYRLVQSGGASTTLGGIFLTHAHVGHYVGLIHLGQESMAMAGCPVYAMPRMADFLRRNAPWSRLVEDGHVDLRVLEPDQPVPLSPSMRLTPVRVPHREDLSETVAFYLEGPNQRVLYVPDVDTWSGWPRSIESWLEEVDVAYLDGTFFSDRELPGRDIGTVPHPIVEQTLRRFSALPADLRQRVRFFHLNHTNPLLEPSSGPFQAVIRAGCHVAVQGERTCL